MKISSGFRPLIRGFFFYSKAERMKLPPSVTGFRPLIRGFFFYGAYQNPVSRRNESSFRPLIRGFFFYGRKEGNFMLPKFKLFPSPHSGILFLSVEYPNYKDMTADEIRAATKEFPSPHSGILFLSACSREYIVEIDCGFPSPHSGILFL